MLDNHQDEHGARLDRAVDEVFEVIPVFMKRLKAMNASLLAGTAITHQHLKLLFAVDRSGPLAMSELARKLEIAKPNLTVLVDRLEQSGHLERRPDPADRRVSLLCLTPLGAQTLASYHAAFRERVRDGLWKFSPHELAELEATLASLRSLMERLTPEER